MLYKRQTVLRAAILLVFSLMGVSLFSATKWQPGLGEPLVWSLPDDQHGVETYTWNVVWDSRGNAYLGRDYLWRWDGRKLEKIGSTSFMDLRGMFIDEEGLLWLAGINQFGVYDPQTGSFRSMKHWLPNGYKQFGEAWMLYHDGNSVWMGTDRMLFRMNESEASVWEFDGDHRVIFHILNSGIYAHETNIGLWKVTDKGKRLVCSDPALAEKSVLFLEDQSDGRLLALSGIGIFHLYPDLDRPVCNQSELRIGDPKISSVRRISKEIIAIGTLSQGLVFVNDSGEILHEFSGRSDSGIEDGIILYLDTDVDGRLWVLNSKGVNVVETNLPVGRIDTLCNHSIGVVNGMIQTNDSLTISSETGNYHTSLSNIEDSTSQRLTANPSFKVEEMFSGVVFPDYNKLYYVEEGSVELLHEFPGAISNFSVSDKGIVFVAFPSELVAYDIQTSKELRFLGKLASENNLQKLGVDGQGHLWGWSPHAPLVEAWIDEDHQLKMKRHTEVAGHLLEESDCRLAVTKQGPILIFTDKLLWLGEGSADWTSAVLEQETNLTEAYFFTATDTQLEGWMINWDSDSSFHKVIHISWDQDSGIHEKTLPWPDMGGLGRITEFLWVDLPGIRWVVGGSEGLLLAGPELPDLIPTPQVPVIYGDDPVISTRLPDTYTYGEGLLEFHFRSIDRGGHYPVSYQTRLSSKEDWSDSSPAGIRSIGLLAAGNYTFEVRAVDPFERISPVAQYEFSVLPPWYWSPLAWIGYAVMTVICIYFLIQLSNKRMRIQQEILEKQVKERTADLIREGAFKDDLIANLSHEIRNPLNGIIGLIRQMREGEVPPANNIKALRGAAQYLHATVEEVLDFSKLESGTVQLEYKPLDLSEVAESVLEIYREQAAGRGLAFFKRLNIPQGIGIVSDSRKIQQVIGNLTGNAVKFTETGSVNVDLTLTRDLEDVGTFHLRVMDTGSGIPLDEQERVFEKFVRLKRTGFRDGGTGIGLALVKSYADRMGAELRLESEPGVGSTFSMSMPVELCCLKSGQEQATDESLSGKSLRVLVVEDVEYNRIVLEDLLTGLGCQVESAERGKLGLEMGLRGNYNVIFLDWEVPEMNGLEIARTLRASNGIPQETRIFALTAYATREVEKQCIDAGMDAFLTKPINPDRIRKLLLEVEDAECDSVAWDARPDDSMLFSGKVILGRGKLGEMMDGDWEAARKRFDSFWIEYFDELTCSIESGDLVSIRKSAHKFLGFIQMVDLCLLPDCLRSIQDAAREGDAERVHSQWDLLMELIPQFHKEWVRM